MKTIIAALVSALFIGGAYAQSPSMTAAAAPNANTAAVPADTRANAKVEMHIKDLHAKLKITAAEETQWTAVAQAMRTSADEVDTAINARESGAKTANAVEDLNAYGTIAQAHADGVKRMASSFGPLYAAMSDDQKRVADDVFAQRAAHAEKKAAVTK
jgi:protein CpxP